MNLSQKLFDYFGFKSFRPGQKEILELLIAGKNTLAVLPTGGGKTLIYQMFGAMTNRTVLIVSPLISLMEDQVARLQFLGSKNVVAINSLISPQDRFSALKNLKQFKFIYISPEMLSNPKVISQIQRLDIGLLVVDEAHCISTWGPDFRPDYLKLGDVRKKLKSPLTLMMTATANRQTRADIIKKMGFKSSEVKSFVLPINRPNIFLAAKQFLNETQKDQMLVKLVSKIHSPGIIYFSNKQKTEEISSLLNQRTDKKVLPYHAGLDTASRMKVQQQFMNDDVDIICATSAFGMGIDKNNIRFVIHYHIPDSLSDYVQEIGRAGRDNKQSVAIALYEPNDRFIQQNLIDLSMPNFKQIEYIYQHPDIEFDTDQYRILRYYFENSPSKEETENEFKNIRIFRQKQLDKMVKYVQFTQCRRKFLNNDFDQSDNRTDSKRCCDNDFEFWENSEEFNQKYLNKLRKKSVPSDWRKVVNNLFLLKN